MPTHFYERVSTKAQDPKSQVEAARERGIPTSNIVVEVASGAKNDRPQLAKLLAEQHVSHDDDCKCAEYERQRVPTSVLAADVVAGTGLMGISLRGHCCSPYFYTQTQPGPRRCVPFGSVELGSIGF